MGGVSALKIDTSDAELFLPSGTLQLLEAPLTEVVNELESGCGPGSDYLGWLDLPVQVTSAQIAAMTAAAVRARDDAEVYVVIGIGGSYLGTKAVLDALGAGKASRAVDALHLSGGARDRREVDDGERRHPAPEILFAGTNLCSITARRLLEGVRDREVRLCVASKSGTTLEPALAFRLLRSLMEKRYGRKGAAGRITVVTDARKGVLKQMAEAEGYEAFVVPDNVGGRFSVLTPVGLLPLAVAGVDIRELLHGAAAMRESSQNEDLLTNAAHLYAAMRFALYREGFTTEILSTFHSGLTTFQEWWKQLYGESEGKDGKGIFPASALFTTDLHSLGQYIQEGRRQLLETFLCVREGDPSLAVPVATSDDGLDYLTGKSLDEINWKAFAGTRKAHVKGGVPCLSLEVERLTPFTMGALIYFFEKAVAVSGRLLGVNPFDQPGVEAYKREMFNLLGRP